MTRTFLAIVGILYFLLGVWCSVLPRQTSQTVGFELKPGAGQSEYLTVYGGLEVALGIILLWPLLRPETAPHTLWICLILHGCLVAFRTLGFVLYDNIPSTTYFLAATEWIVLIASVVLTYWQKTDPTT